VKRLDQRPTLVCARPARRLSRALPSLGVEVRRWLRAASVVGLRDRAIIAVMTYTFARVGVVVALNVEDYFWDSGSASRNGVNEL
jgi:hypothetical protein